MSSLQSTVIHGNLDVLPSPTGLDQGSGDVNISHNVIVSGTQASSSAITGAVVIVGGMGISGSEWIDTDLNVNGVTNLDKTYIDTTDGLFSVSGTNGVTVNVTNAVSITSATTSNMTITNGNLTLTSSNGQASLNGNTLVDVECSSGGITLNSAGTSNFTTTGAYTLTLESTGGRASLKSGSALTNAVLISSYNAAGGISITSGSQGINQVATNGPINLTGNGAASSFSFTADANAQDLSISLASSPANSSKISITSGGNTSGALTLATPAGGMTLNAASSYSMTAGTSFNMSGTGAASGISLAATGSNQDLTFALTGATTSNLNINSAGGVSMNTSGGSIRLTSARAYYSTSANYTSIHSRHGMSLVANELTYDDMYGMYIGYDTFIDADSNIFIPPAFLTINSDSVLTESITMTSKGGIVTTAVSRFGVDVSAGGIRMNGNAEASNFSLTSTAAGQDLKFELGGATASRLYLLSSGTGVDSIKINSTGGGINATAIGEIAIDTVDAISGIRIGTYNTGIPIVIGNAVSETTFGQNVTITGNLTVQGLTTTINSTTVTTEDNIIIVNSSPFLSADGGLLVKRFQRVDAATDDVVMDAPQETSGIHGGNSQAGGSSTTIILNAGANSTNNFYNGWWIKITSGGGSGQIRRIKSYVGATRVATIYATTEADGLNWATIPDNMQYNLYADAYIADVYDELHDEWIFATTATVPGVEGSVVPQKYINLHAGALDIDRSISVDSIVEHTNNAGVTVEGVLFKDGAISNVVSINGNAVDISEAVVLPDNTSSQITITATNTRGTFMCLVASQSAGSSCGLFMASKAVITDIGAVNRMTVSKGSHNERVDVAWPASDKLKLTFSVAPGTGLSTTFMVKTIMVI